jgi:hypothetical protein
MISVLGTYTAVKFDARETSKIVLMDNKYISSTHPFSTTLLGMEGML